MKISDWKEIKFNYQNKKIYIYLREAITRNSKTGSACIVYVIGEGSIIFESSESKKWNSWQVDSWGEVLREGESDEQRDRKKN